MKNTILREKSPKIKDKGIHMPNIIAQLHFCTLHHQGANLNSMGSVQPEVQIFMGMHNALVEENP